MNFLFDIGRVLLDFDFGSSITRILPPGAGDAAARLERMLDRKDDFEAGRIPEEEYIAWAIGVLGSPATPDEFRDAWRNIFTPNEPMWEVVRRLAADGHRLILFSNINSIHSPWIFGKFPELSLFHGAVLSYQTGFIKPDDGIYHHAVREHGLVPAETIYIDDMPRNCEAGRRLGFRTWQYDLNNHAAFEAWLATELSVPAV